jgi:hypothetical protein
MPKKILYDIAGALGTAAGYLESFGMRDLFSIIKTSLLMVCTLGGAYVLYAFFYLNESLAAIF